MTVISSEQAGGANVCAFLDLLAVSEGTSTNDKTQNDGYDVICGGSIFTDYSDHPRVLVSFPKLGIKSTAAGRYQELERFYDVYKVQLKLPDFSPLSQDLIALQMIRECDAIKMLQNGDIASALTACASRWASLPASHYGQHVQTIQMLVAAYEAAGGVVA